MPLVGAVALGASCLPRIVVVAAAAAAAAAAGSNFGIGSVACPSPPCCCIAEIAQGLSCTYQIVAAAVPEIFVAVVEMTVEAVETAAGLLVPNAA